MGVQQPAASGVGTDVADRKVDAHAHLRRQGRQLIAEGRFEEANAVFGRLEHLAPHDVANIVLIGDLSKELGRPADAVAAYGRAAARLQDAGDVRRALAVEEKAAALGDAAARGRCIDLNLALWAEDPESDAGAVPRDRALRMLLDGAEAALALQDHEGAVACFRRLVEVDPLNAEICMRLARLLLQLQRRKEAVDCLVRAAKGLLKRRMLREAGDVIIEASRLDDNNADIKVLFFRMQLAEGYVKVGLDGLHKLHKEHPRNADVIETLARAYVSFNQLEVAGDWFLKAFLIDGAAAPVEHVARKLLEKGNPDGALKILQPVAEKHLAEERLSAARAVLDIIHSRGEHRRTMELLYEMHRQAGQDEQAGHYLSCILTMFGARNRGQEGLAYIWKLLENEEEDGWRTRMEHLTTRFLAARGKKSAPREFPPPEPGRRSGEYVQAKNQSLEDLIAGLPNRRLLKARLELAMRRGRRHNQLVALLLLDFDRTRQLGLEVSAAASQKLVFAALKAAAGALRGADTLAYLGGDEFAVLLQSVNLPRNIVRVVGQLLESIGRKVTVDGFDVVPCCHIGVAVYPNDGDQVGSLLRKADQALLRAREKGDNAYALYTEQMQVFMRPKHGLEQDLEGALERGEMRLHYQPIVDLRRDPCPIVGMETLMRWAHPSRGLLFPGDFISAAGETGMLGRLGHWGLQTAVAQAADWHRRRLRVPWLTLNLSADQVRDRTFSAALKRTIEAQELPRGVLQLVLESSEALMLDDSEETRAQLHGIRRMGIGLAVDDFGTGSASVVNLKRAPVSAIKIDASHVRLLHDADVAALVRGLIVLARAFKLSVVAEGIESKEQAAFLRDAGCDYGQGYYFAKPMDAEAAGRLLAGGVLPPA